VSPSVTSPRPRIWGVGTIRTLRPIWMCHELGIEFDLEPIHTRTASMDNPDFASLSERGKIPLLEHGDVVIGESAAISLYLADHYRSKAVLAPKPGAVERALHDELCWFTMTEMDAILYTIRRHEGLPEIYGASDVACSAAREYALRSAGEMERRLSDGRAFLLGDEFTVADLLFKTCLDWAVFAAQIELPTSLRQYFGAMSARPAYTLAMTSNFPPEALALLTQTPSED
jgi:glutathione S-transferase